MVENRTTRGSPALLRLALLGAALCVGWMMVVREPIRLPRTGAGRPVPRTAETGAPAAPSLGEIEWGEHAFERHGADAQRVIDRLRVCEPRVWFCDGPTTRDTYWVYVCELNGSLCAGALVGRLGVAFTAYPSSCTWWLSKTKGCQPTKLAGR